jgi:phosphoglycolate phosphatase
MTDRRFETVCLDMAGTTVDDGDAVTEAFGHAFATLGGEADRRAAYDRFVSETMGRSKIDVFEEWFGDGVLARMANEAFEDYYATLVGAGRCRPVEGAVETLNSMRAAGMAVVLITGFSPRTRDHLLDHLGWTSLVDLVLSPSDAGRGRPFPDLVLTALLRTGATRTSGVVVVGDTPSDMESGVRAGAGLTIGVRSGGVSARQLFAAGAQVVCTTVADVPAVVGVEDL